MSMACCILALNCESYLTLKMVLDSSGLALVLVSRVQASASALALKGPGLSLGPGLECPGLGLGLGLGLEGPDLGLVLGLWILALTTTLPLATSRISLIWLMHCLYYLILCDFCKYVYFVVYKKRTSHQATYHEYCVQDRHIWRNTFLFKLVSK